MPATLARLPDRFSSLVISFCTTACASIAEAIRHSGTFPSSNDFKPSAAVFGLIIVATNEDFGVHQPDSFQPDYRKWIAVRQ
jgi:hypothetical protein